MTHLFSASLVPTLSAIRPNVSLIASFDVLGNCFFKISIKPVLVRSLPWIASLKSSISSGATIFFGGFGGLAGVAGVAAEREGWALEFEGVERAVGVLLGWMTWSDSRGGFMMVGGECEMVEVGRVRVGQYAVE